MTKVTMPEPVALSNPKTTGVSIYGYTEDQMEAYAVARVQEALEEAAAICQEEGDEWDSDGLQTYRNYAHVCRNRIRNLIPPA